MMAKLRNPIQSFKQQNLENRLQEKFKSLQNIFKFHIFAKMYVKDDAPPAPSTTVKATEGPLILQRDILGNKRLLPILDKEMKVFDLNLYKEWIREKKTNSKAKLSYLTNLKSLLMERKETEDIKISILQRDKNFKKITCTPIQKPF